MVEVIHKVMWPVVWLILVVIMLIGTGAVLFFIWGIIFIVIMGGSNEDNRNKILQHRRYLGHAVKLHRLACMDKRMDG